MQERELDIAKGQQQIQKQQFDQQIQQTELDRAQRGEALQTEQIASAARN